MRHLIINIVFQIILFEIRLFEIKQINSVDKIERSQKQSQQHRAAPSSLKGEFYTKAPWVATHPRPCDNRRHKYTDKALSAPAVAGLHTAAAAAAAADVAVR